MPSPAPRPIRPRPVILPLHPGRRKAGPVPFGVGPDRPAAKRPEPMVMFVREAVPHDLEILTEEEWRSLAPEDKPEEFLPYRPGCYVRMKVSKLLRRAD